MSSGYYNTIAMHVVSVCDTVRQTMSILVESATICKAIIQRSCNWMIYVYRLTSSHALQRHLLETFHLHWCWYSATVALWADEIPLYKFASNSLGNNSQSTSAFQRHISSNTRVYLHAHQRTPAKIWGVPQSYTLRKRLSMFVRLLSVLAYDVRGYLSICVVKMYFYLRR